MINVKMTRFFGVCMLVSLLGACGGGGGGGGSAPAGGDAGGGTTTPGGGTTAPGGGTTTPGGSAPDGWQVSAVIHSDGDYPDLLGSSVDVNSSGQAVAVWNTYDMTSEAYRSRVAVNVAGSWSTPMDVVSGAGASEARVAINDAGEAVVVWTQLSTLLVGERDLWARHYAAGSWGVPQRLTPALTGGDYYLAYEMRLGKDGSGRFHVIWDGDSINHALPGVYYRRFEDGAWTTEEKIAERPTYVNPHQLHVMANGDLYYLYTEPLTDATGVRLKKRISGVWGSPEALDAGLPATYDGPGNGDLDGIRFSVNTAGDILVAWSDSYYDATAAANRTVIISKAFHADTGTWRATRISEAASAQYAYVTALNDAGQGAVAWFREPADATGYEGNIRFVVHDVAADTASAETDVYASELAPVPFKDFRLVARDNGDIWLASLRSGLNLFKLESGSVTSLGRLASASESLSCAEQGSAAACAWGTFNLAFPWSTELAGAVLVP